jgi:hypothetical protein
MATKIDHSGGLATSSTLSGYYVENFIAPKDVIRVLNDAAIRFMLVGAHGLAGWIDEPRATQDVGILVGQRSHKKAVRILLHTFPRLVSQDHEVMTRLLDQETKRVLIDVMKTNQPLFREGLKHAHLVESGKERYLVPNLEMALAMKFAPMVSLTRADEKKYLDAHDFIRMVRVNPDIDLEKLAQLGELVYAGGGQEILERVRQVRAGEKLNL